MSHIVARNNLLLIRWG